VFEGFISVNRAKSSSDPEDSFILKSAQSSQSKFLMPEAASESAVDKLVPECMPLKKFYGDCMDKWMEEKSRLIRPLGAPHTCEEHFSDYKDCITLGMKLLSSKKAQQK